MLMREAVGYTIREMRTEQQLYGVTVASLAHVAVGHLNNVEHGKKEMSSELLERVASALGVTVGQILARAGVVMTELDHLTGELDRPTVIV
jgi:transcriptional regulator with XRE-family HTH domain